MRSIFAALFLLSTPASAQTFPDYENLYVNDYADLLVPADERALTRQLSQLKKDVGVEMTVLTLDTQKDYAPGMTLEAFATGLFNTWGIGDANRNDGVLVLVIRNDRVMRLELGAGFAKEWDRVARNVVDDHFLPSLRNDRFSQGILRGTEATIQEIVLPFKEGAEPSKDNVRLWFFGLIAVLAVLSKGRGYIGDMFARFRTCPNCGKRGLRQTRRTIMSASTASSGTGTRRVECLHCDYETETTFIIPRISKSSGSGFGGGRSGGGGASGRF